MPVVEPEEIISVTPSGPFGSSLKGYQSASIALRRKSSEFKNLILSSAEPIASISAAASGRVHSC
jgi:hypothetical protein